MEEFFSVRGSKWAIGRMARTARQNLSDERLRKRTLGAVAIRLNILSTADFWGREDCSLPSNPTDEDPGRWPQAVFFRALAGAAEVENMPDILTAMRRHYLNDTKATTSTDLTVLATYRW